MTCKYHVGYIYIYQILEQDNIFKLILIFKYNSSIENRNYQIDIIAFHLKWYRNVA